MDKSYLERIEVNNLKNPNIAAAVAAGAAIAVAGGFVWKRVKNRKAQK